MAGAASVKLGGGRSCARHQAVVGTRTGRSAIPIILEPATGCLTEVGVTATATDAMQQGFAIEVPADSQVLATTRPLELDLVRSPRGRKPRQTLKPWEPLE